METKFIGTFALATIILSACAAPNVDRSAINFNETKFAVDLNICRGDDIAGATMETIGIGILGSLGGARRFLLDSIVRC